MFWKNRQLFQKAQEALERNDFAEAERELSLLLEKSPEAIEALWHRALVRVRLGRKEEALDDARRASDLRPENAIGFMILGEVFFSLSAYQEAYESFQKACRMEKDNGRAFFGWAKASLALGRPEEAADHMEVALQFERDFVNAQMFVEILKINLDS
jgi:tetratricopeptide (TPR) repeat protein